jgi:hypothetical protein
MTTRSYLLVPFRGAAKVALLCRPTARMGYVAEVEGAGCLVELKDADVVPKLATRLSAKMKKADILQIDRDGAGEEATLSVQQWGDGHVVARHTPGLIVQALPQTAQSLVLGGRRVSDLDGAVDISTVQPADSLSGAQQRMVRSFELAMIAAVFLLAIMLILVGLTGNEDGTISWVRFGFGVLAGLYALWRMRNVLRQRRSR